MSVIGFITSIGLSAFPQITKMSAISPPSSEVPVPPLREAVLQHCGPAGAPAQARGAQVQVQGPIV